MEVNEDVLSNFSVESLNEMKMENVEGGMLPHELNIHQCPAINNCAGGNCTKICSAKPTEDEENLTTI